MRGLVAIYVKRINLKEDDERHMTIEEVPLRWRAKVQAELDAQQK